MVRSGLCYQSSFFAPDRKVKVLMKSSLKKLIAFALATAVGAVLAYPPPIYFCSKECRQQAPVGTPEYDECMRDCMSMYP